MNETSPRGSIKSPTNGDAQWGSRRSSSNKVSPTSNGIPPQEKVKLEEFENNDTLKTESSNNGVVVAVLPATGKVGNPDGWKDPDDPVEKEKKERREKEPLLFCKFIANYPKTSFGLTLGGHMLLVLVTAVMIQVGYNILPFNLSQLPLYLGDDVDYLRQSAWNSRNLEANDIVNRLQTSSTIASERSRVAEVLEIYHEILDGNVFTKEALEVIQSLEDEIFNMKEFQSTFCLLNNAGNCSKPTSILRYFDGTYASENAAMNDSDFSNIPLALEAALTENKTKSDIRYHLGANYSIDAAQNIAKSAITRSRFLIAYPLPGYNGTEDRQAEQLQKVEEFVNTTLWKLLKKLEKEKRGGVDFFYYTNTLVGLAISETAMGDLLLVAAGLGFIFIFMWIQTGSLWITGFGTLSIFTGFLGANLIYRVVLDYIYFGTFNILGIFIILGIGADDIFIFVDTFKLTGHFEYPSLAHRLSDCYRKASVAMLFTSVTTATAFFISAASPLLGVSTFGLFTGLLVLVNYLSVILFIPCVVINWHISWEKCRCFPCFAKRSTVTDAKGSPTHQTSSNGDHQRKNPIVRFFRGPYYKFITHKIARWVIIGFFVVLATLFTYFATQLQPNEEQIEFLKPDSNFGKVFARRTDGFAPSDVDRNVKVYIVWGLKHHDFSACHKTNTSCEGKTVWDDTFDMNYAEAQNALLDFCAYMKNLSKQEESDLKVRRNVFTNELEVQCFMDDLNSFMRTEQDAVIPVGPMPRKYPVNTNLTIPLQNDNMQTLMQTNTFLYNTSALPNNFRRYFETGISYWMYGGFNLNADRSDYSAYNSLLGEQQEIGQTQNYKTFTDYKFGNRLRYAAIQINTIVNGATLGYPKGIPLRDVWEKFASVKISQMPTPLKGGFQMTTSSWHWVKVQENLANSALLGILIGVCVAYPILIAATNNIITGTLAVLILGCITVSVVGFIPMMGWKLGVLESLNMVLVVGLSVDYVVHLAEGYSRSSHVDRLRRTQDMLEEVGISVLSGAVTTIGAALCMLLAQILFFTQFGLILFITIAFSILYALVLFTTIMGIIGPQGDTGRVSALFRKCCKK